MRARWIHSTDPAFLEAQRDSWSQPPIDGVGYISSTEMLKKSDEELRQIVVKFEKERYGVDGWRNHQNKWREKLGLDDTRGKVVLDFGCGTGIESLQLARAGNIVYAADIAPDNARLASRLAAAHGLSVRPVELSLDFPYWLDEQVPPPVDVVHCIGSIHHIPHARLILRRAAGALAPDGEIRMMLYSDVGWKISTGEPVPPVEEDVETNPAFRKFTGVFDYVGAYADWYSAEKLRHRFGEFLELVRFDYICSDDAFCVAVMKRR